MPIDRRSSTSSPAWKPGPRPRAPWPGWATPPKTPR